MNAHTATSDSAITVETSQRDPLGLSLRRAIIWLGIFIAAGGAWLVAHREYYTPGSDLGYYMGLVGGLMMALLLGYPLRKHFRFMHGWGPLKHWFKIHMFLGITGPTLVLFHSTFSIGSINAAVALTSMLLVAGSGIIGRFIYRRIHQGLYGRQLALKELSDELGMHAKSVASHLRFAPQAEALLHAFETHAKDHSGSLLTRIWRFITLGWHARQTRRQCRQAIKQALKLEAKQKGWDRDAVRKYFAEITRTVNDFILEIQRVHQFATYERMFALWHVLHVPFVYMLVFSAIFHVIAVHMY